MKFKGYCLHDNKRLLVYEFLENGGLSTILFGEFYNYKFFFGQIIFINVRTLGLQIIYFKDVQSCKKKKKGLIKLILKNN